MSGAQAIWASTRSRFLSLTLKSQTSVAYSAVVFLAAILRLTNLQSPNTLVFDEVYYVRDAWTMLNLGYEGQWPDGVDFVEGGGEGFTTEGEFIAHPPLGKWLIAIGLAIFGPVNPFGWRLITALSGIFVVLLTMLIARRIFASLATATLSGFIVAIDGIAITMSRTALLDGMLAMFILAALLALLRHLDSPKTGIWLVVAGVLLGAATAVKWSGLYAVAAFGIWVVASEAWRSYRKSPGRSLARSMAFPAIRSAVLVLPFVAITYLASWSGWFFSEGGYDRNSSETGGVFGAFESLWKYHQAMYGYNIGLVTPHSYQANPFGWLLMIRPTAFFYDASIGNDLTQYITSVANPLTWWLGVIALGFVFWFALKRFYWPGTVILAGVAATYIPWLFFSHRTVFQFYTVSLEPFLALALAFGLTLLYRNRRGSISRGLVVAAAAVSAFFMPVWLGLPVPIWFAALHYWFVTWI
jgi:dolichyl-phosphate-mannose--protein O-mannosyl transferase